MFTRYNTLKGPDRDKYYRECKFRLLKQETIYHDITIDKSFNDIKPEWVKCKKINGNVTIELDHIPLWFKNIESLILDY